MTSVGFVWYTVRMNQQVSNRFNVWMVSLCVFAVFFGVFGQSFAAIPGTSSVSSVVGKATTTPTVKQEKKPTKKVTPVQKKPAKKTTTKPTTKQKQVAATAPNTTQNSLAINQGLLYKALQEQITFYEKKKTVEGLLRTSNQKKIESIRGSINAGAQYAANNPNNASSIEYLNGIFQKQIEFKQKMLEHSIAVDGIFQGAIDTQKKALEHIPKVTTQKELDGILQTFYYFRSQLGEYDTYSKVEWDQNNKMDAEANATANDLAKSFQ